MTDFYTYSEWIKEFYRKEGTDEAVDVLLRIDKLLRKSMNSTDDENLSEEIRKEINEN